MSAVAHIYRYAGASTITHDARPQLFLATSNTAGDSYPHFFTGTVRHPRLMAELLTSLHLVVGSRFFTPANTVAHAIALADPVVTSGDGLLRFEGFSSCCSTYARVDLLSDGYDGQVVGRGTTNVDFNAPMRAALSGVRDESGLDLSVGKDEFVLRSGGGEIVERKVDLPLRWLRGMLEVQSYQASMSKMFEVSGLEAMRFIRSLPKSSTTRTPLWAVPGPSGMFTTTQATARGVRITDTRRLRLMQSLLPKAASLAVYADDAQQASAWVLTFPGARFTVTLSAEVWRGFSGEGQGLRALMRNRQAGTAAALGEVRARLQWQSTLRANELAQSLRLPEVNVEDSLRVLGMSGLVGFDVHDRGYFHRVLPFDLSLAEDMHPRLVSAIDLLDQGAVSILKVLPLDATVKSGDVLHRVRETDSGLRCTCPWFAKYQGGRGPCKHVLAAEALRAQLSK